MAKAQLQYSISESQGSAKTPFHFFASSVAEWHTAEDLPDLIEKMKKGGYPFNLFFVPVAASAEYQISNYAPQVEGARFLGFWGE